jgi:hypothetical protein
MFVVASIKESKESYATEFATKVAGVKYIRDKLETLDPMQQVHASACDVTGQCMHVTGQYMHVLHTLLHDITGRCMHLLHGLFCFDFVSDIPLPPASLVCHSHFGGKL